MAVVRRRQIVGECWYSVAIAAAKLDVGEQALRARCRRAARLVDGEMQADLGMGVLAKKLGSSWRISVPTPEG